MPSDKDRLYVVLYARAGPPTMPGGEDKYHWGLITGPKIETKNSKGYRFHAKSEIRVSENGPRNVWLYEEASIGMLPTRMQLARVAIAKVKDLERLRRILQTVPVRGELEGWNCVGWVKEAFETLRADGKALGTCAEGWQEVRDEAMRYVAQKAAAHRYDGTVEVDFTKAATWDMLAGVELIE